MVNGGIMERKRLMNGVQFGDLLFLDGWCVNNEGMTMEEEIRTCFDQVAAYLATIGASLKDVLRATVYLRDINDRERFLNVLWKKYFPENPPARTCVEVGLGKCRIEIDFIVGLSGKT